MAETNDVHNSKTNGMCLPYTTNGGSPEKIVYVEAVWTLSKLLTLTLIPESTTESTEIVNGVEPTNDGENNDEEGAAEQGGDSMFPRSYPDRIADIASFLVWHVY